MPPVLSQALECFPLARKLITEDEQFPATMEMPACRRLIEPALACTKMGSFYVEQLHHADNKTHGRTAAYENQGLCYPGE